MKTAFRIAAAFTALALSAGALVGAASADPFRVKDILVDETAATTNDSVRQGVASARLTGAQRLINRLTLPEDRSAASQPPEATDVARLYLSYDTGADEKRSVTSAGARYIATLAINFDSKAVRQYLEQRNIPYVDSQADKALIVPAAGAGVNSAAWGAVWMNNGAPKADDSMLTPYVSSVEAWDRHPTWDDVQAETTRQGLIRAVVAEAYSQNGQIYVRLSDMKAGQPETVIGISGPSGDLRSAQGAALTALENAYKKASIVRTTGSTSLSLVAAFTDMTQWVRIRRSLESSRLVSGLSIESISPTGADLAFVFAGRPDQLAADLRSRGINLRGADDGWLIEVAAGQ